MADRDHPLGALGAAAARHRHLTLIAWLVLVMTAAWLAADLPASLQGGIDPIADTDAARVEQVLGRDFDSPFAQFLVVTLERADGGATAAAEAALTRRLEQDARITRVMPMPENDPARAALLVGLNARTLDEAEALVPPVRQVLREAVPPDVSVAATGQAAFGLDFAAFGDAETRRAEQTVLPLTLLALLVAFGALGAAGAPIVAGTAAMVLALGLLAIVTHFLPLSAYSANIVSMLGLGLGIDYALFVVARVREERHAGADDGEAVDRAVRHAAPAIAISAGTVLIGLLALLTVPAGDMIGLGVGGAVVAATSALAGITLLPAIVARLGRWLDAPRLLATRRHGPEQQARWERRARRVLRRPLAALLVSVGVLIVLALPVRHLKLGDPEVAMLPDALEAIRAVRVLQRMDMGGAAMPLRLVVQDPAGGGVLSAERLPGLLELTTRLRQDPRVAEVYALADPARGGERLALALAWMGPDWVRQQLPADAQLLLSRNGDATAINVVLRNDVTIQQANDLAWTIKGTDWQIVPGLTGLRVMLGGTVAIATDFIDVTVAAFPRLMLLVVGATFLMLFLMTRSLLIPVKAVLANLLTVAGALGATFWACGSPTVSAWLGFAQPVTAFSPGIPLLTFCVVFGLSMDYEVFLISRIQEAHRSGQDDREAVVRGIAGSGAVITSAAVIMAIVFFGFALTDLLPVKILGLALAIGVLLDATLVRLLLVPALMTVAGRWNWWPGSAKEAERAS